MKSDSHYRAQAMALWTWLVPQLQNVGQLEFLTLRSPSYNFQHEEPRNPEERLQELSVLHHLFPKHDDPSLYVGNVRPLTHMAGHYILPTSTTTVHPTLRNQPDHPPIQPLSSDLMHNMSIQGETKVPGSSGDYFTYSTALSVTIAVGLSLLLLNAVIFATFYYKKDRKYEDSSKHDQTSNSSGSENQMVALSDSCGSLIGSTSMLDVISKSPQSTLDMIQHSISPSVYTRPQTFHHISPCPPAFADTLVTYANETQTILPLNTSISTGSDLVASTTKRPPRLMTVPQPLLPANIPAPPRGRIPTSDELRV